MIEKLGKDGATYTGGTIANFALLTQRAALSLEVVGMKRSKGPSVYSIVKKAYGFKGTKQEVLTQFDDYISKHVVHIIQRGVKGDS